MEDGRPPLGERLQAFLTVFAHQGGLIRLLLEVQRGVEVQRQPVVDDVLRRAYIKQIEAAPVSGYFYMSSRRRLVPRVLAPMLEAVAPTIHVGIEPLMFSQEDDVIVEPHPEGDDEVYLVYRRGWGECNVACEGQHWWRVRVTPTESELVEDWGAPIPVDVLERWKEPDPDRIG